MRKLKHVLGLFMAVLMLLACMPLALASPEGEPEPEQAAAAPQKQAEPDNVEPLKGEAIAPEAQKGSVDIDTPTWEVSLTDAANPADTLYPVEIAAYSEWVAQRDLDLGRYVAAAPIPSAAGTYTKRMYTGTITLEPYKTKYVCFNACVHFGEGQSFSVICTNEATAETWEVDFNSEYNDIWYEYSFPVTNGMPNYDYTQSYQVDVTFVYSFTVSGSKGGGETSKCCVTDLEVFGLSDLDHALNVPDSNLNFTTADDNSNDPFDSAAYPHVARHFVRFDGRDRENFVCGVTTHVVAARGDVLTYEVVSDLDYMNGTSFLFGIGTSYEDMQVLEYGDESGNGSLWYDWETFSYTIPANGEYDFIWVLAGDYDTSSYAYLDNVRLTPRMSAERALNEYVFEVNTYSDADDTPWYPTYFNNEFCMRSGNIDHGETSTLITEHNMFKAEDWFYFRLWTSCEKNYDVFRCILVNEQTGTEEEVIVDSGISTGWSAYGSKIEEDGIYTIRFVYEKDGSVSSGNDCVYLDYVTVLPMTQTHAVAYDDIAEERLSAWDYYPESRYRFVPAMYEGEVVLISNNRGVASSSACLYFTAELEEQGQFTFDYIKDAEANYDKLNITVNGETTVIKPRSTTWQTYTYTADSAGEYTFEVSFTKDNSVNTGTDTAYIRNARVITLDDMLNEAVLYDYYGYDLLFHDKTCDGMFTVDEVDDRLVAGFCSTDPANAAFYYQGYRWAFMYVRFDYFVTGSDAQFSLVANGDTVYTVDWATEVWRTGYYRIPYSGNWKFEFCAVSSGDTVYIDNVLIDYVYIPLEQGLESNDGEPAALDYSDSYGFTGIYDFDAPHGWYNAAWSTSPWEGVAKLSFDQHMYPGDSFDFDYCFMDEDGEPNGSTIEFYVNGELAATRDDRWVDDPRYVWFKAPREGDYHFSIVYHRAETAAVGDCVCVTSVDYDPIGITLDEALNVEGGNIHFYAGGVGGFVPCKPGDIYYFGAYASPISGVFGEHNSTSELYFELDVQAGDSIRFETSLVGYIGSVLPYGTYDDTVLVLSQDGEIIFSVTLQELYDLWHDHDYDDDYWINRFSVTVPESGHSTFIFSEYKSDNLDHDLLIDLDNVELVRGQHGLPGDVNCDGYVTFNDISALYLFLIGEADLSEQGRINADYNGDGEVNFLDISELYLFLLG